MPKSSEGPSKATSKARARADPVAKKPKKATAARSSDPPPTDPSKWRKSTIPIGQTISKTLAMKTYHLSAADMDELTYTSTETVVNGKFLKNMYLYNERDVERKAWERRGGPEAFDAYEEKLRSRRDARAANKTQSTRPAPRNGERLPTISIARLPPGPSVTEEDIKNLIHVGKSAKLFRIKQQMPQWLWEAYNERLDFVDYADPYPGTAGLSRKDREEMMLEALAVSGTYPARPRLPPSPTPSPAIDGLRAVLQGCSAST
ncbi:hypothetical protein C8Q73DRAFT_92020 [Cubamyces lactineus]|nr:hypothetical protein C8Q73DRAFT_92020 [Cubamyces lactineus]